MTNEPKEQEAHQESSQGETAKASPPVTRTAQPKARPAQDPYLRALNEDDDGYDPYSDRPATPEPLFERDPWS